MREFVDSDVLIEVLRGSAQASSWIEGRPQDLIAIPGMVAVELLEGCETKRDLTSVEEILSKISVEWPDLDIFYEAFNLFRALKFQSGIGMADCLIAVTALSESGILYTFNKKHFRHVPNLRFKEPYSRSIED